MKRYLVYIIILGGLGYMFLNAGTTTIGTKTQARIEALNNV